MSRLLDNSNQIRDSLEARNLYTPEDPYDANASNTVSTINNIVNIVSPFSSFDLTNTVVGRLVGNNTPLTEIGLQMLAIQFGRTAASNASAEYLPTISFGNLFDGNTGTSFVTVKQDFQITRRELQSNIGRILEEISGNYPLKGNPFNENSKKTDYIENSGSGQLQLLLNGSQQRGRGGLNANKYKPSSTDFIAAIKKRGLKYGDQRIPKQYFLDDNNVFRPYNQYKISAVLDIPSINTRLNDEINTFRSNTQDSDFYLEYGASQQFVDGLGSTNNFDNNNGGGEYNFERNAEYNFGLDDGVRLIWGRDGVDDNYKFDVEGFDDPIKNSVQPSESGAFIGKTTRFNFNSGEQFFNLEAGGLLSYTRELLNSKGRYGMFDITKKKFIDKDEQLHFNGSPLRKHVDGTTVDKNRQHSVVDPYDNYVKAIRYNGNKVYNGNENSVIYNSVVPQVVPTIGGAINKNLMFSIENLAVEVNADSTNPKIAFVDDDFGTELPICEKGPNNGRLMWFPPYDIQINENVVVNRTTTNFIGRGEPIYTYNNTERIATLSFKLIIDYPPQVRGLDHVQASRFFAFGGDTQPSTGTLSDKVRQRDELIRQRDSIQPTKKQSNPEIVSKSVDFHFLNDKPNTSEIGDSVQYHLDRFYETDVPAGEQSISPKNFKLNNPFKNQIDNLLREYIYEDKLQPFVEIYLEGSASELFSGLTTTGSDYNLRLSERRIEALKTYIEGEYRANKGRDLTNEKAPVFVTNPIGATGGTATDEASEISDLPSKVARRVKVEFRYNRTTETVPVPISDKERQDIVTLNEQIDALNVEIARLENRSANIGDCEFNPYIIEDGILKGFDATQNNKYKPAFHSQTPEDFHRRLTFLHQCTRQGRAVRKLRGDDNSFSANNSVFGRQPVQILRIGDMFHTKVIIDNMQVDYSDAPWDMNPEGMGMQFMIADVKLQLKLIGGQSLKGPINALQNAVSYNFYANSTFFNDGVYRTATAMEDMQEKENLRVSQKVEGVEQGAGTVTTSDERPAQNVKTNNTPTTTS